MGGGVTIMMVVVAVMLAVSSPLKASRAGPNEAQCHLEKQLAVSACWSVLNGGRPSPDCYHRVRVSHAKCICPDVTPELIIKKIGSINKAIRFIKSCGRKVPHHFKCGSVTTP
ncbi:hypothetical protein R6Q59_015297 [Mikania micrantha]